MNPEALPSVQKGAGIPRRITEDGARLSDAARAHLLLHFSDHGSFQTRPIPVAVRGEGCWIETSDGRRHFDGLSGLFCAQLGYSFGEEIMRNALAEVAELPYYTNWGFAHPPSIELAATVASLAPTSLNHCFFTSGGSEAVESAVKLAWQFHALRGEPLRRKLIARRQAYHGSTGIALSLTGLHGLKAAYEPLVPGVRHVSKTNDRKPGGPWSEPEQTAILARELSDTIEFEGPASVAAVVIEPVQNCGGSIPPPAGYGQAISEVCREYGVLLVVDEVITGFGRMGQWFACERYGLSPDLVTFAKGVSAGHAPIGGVIVSDAVAEPFLAGGAALNHGFTFGGHPLSTAIARRALEIMHRERALEAVAEHESRLSSSLRALAQKTIVTDLRGGGYFWSLELVEPSTGERFDISRADRAIALLRAQLDEQGVMCRVDRRSDDVVLTVAPPLVATPRELDLLSNAIADALDWAAEALDG
jgi:adenosylmethionine-8-amino-7-oxononanoate aminotransferase